MSAAKKIREELHAYIDKLDVKFLKVVHAMIKAYTDEEMILGYTNNGHLITKEMQTKRALKSEEDIKNDNVTDLEELEKEDW